MKTGLTSAELTERRLAARDIARKVVRLSFPAFMSALLVYLIDFLNYLVIAVFLDFKDMAAYGVIFSYITLALGFFIPMAVGSGRLVETAKKSGDQETLANTISSAMLVAILYGIVFTVFAYVIAPWFTAIVRTPADIMETTTECFRYFSFALTPILFFNVTGIILYQLGDRRGPILAEISAVALHAGFCYIFISLFHWDLRGVAISAVIAQSTGAFINLHLLQQVRRSLLVSNAQRFDWNIFRDIITGEKPTIFTAILGGIFAIYLQWFIDGQGTPAIAAFALYFVFQNALFLPVNALQSPMRQLSSEYYEAGGNRTLVRAVDPMFILSFLYCVLLIPISHLVGPWFFMAFSHDALVTETCMKLLNVVCYYYVFYNISTLVAASLEGLGETVVAMRFNIIFNYFVRFAVLLIASNLIQGAESIALCFPLSWALYAAALSIYYYVNYSIYATKYSI